MRKTAVMHSPLPNSPVLDGALRDYLDTNADIVTRIKKPVSIDVVGALSAQSDHRSCSRTSSRNRVTGCATFW